jgi:hypothetical protein
LVDTDATRAGLQADCRVVYHRPAPDPSDPKKIIYVEDATSIPTCDAERLDDEQPAYPCWRVTKDTLRCPMRDQNTLAVLRAPAERRLPLEPGTKTMFLCLTCIEPAPNMPNPRCDH